MAGRSESSTCQNDQRDNAIMMRIVNIVLIAGLIAIATWTYSIKHEAQDLLADIRDFENRIETERESIDFLRADWAYLSDPQRLQALVERYKEDLDLAVTRPDQIATFADLPGPPPAPTGDAVSDIIAGEIDDLLTTGSTAPVESTGGAQ